MHGECRESHPMFSLMNPAIAFILQNRCAQCTPARYPREILRIGKLTGVPLCGENHPLCRLKNLTVVYMITCRLSFCKTCVYNVRLLIILERECSSMYRLIAGGFSRCIDNVDVWNKYTAGKKLSIVCL